MELWEVIEIFIMLRSNNKMRIALLNLPFDNNYGGNLQRYALTKVLQSLGHDVTYLFVKFDIKNPPFYIQVYKSFVYLYRCVVGGKKWDWKSVVTPRQLYDRKCKSANIFVDQNICHTEPIYNVKDLLKHLDYDVFIVGSDQVWRKTIANNYLPTMFFDYLPDRIKRIAYSVSLGSDNNELTDEEIHFYRSLYSKFSAVSVRELSALDLLRMYQWESPNAICTLDPTLLLDKQDYIDLIKAADTTPSEGDMFCYILDPSKEKEDYIQTLIKKNKQKPYYFGINTKYSLSIEQWLRSFWDAKLIVTDSFHGFVFSIIFNKPFYLFRNDFRGNARFDSMSNLLGINLNCTEQDWTLINKNRAREIKKSLDYLMASLQ